MLTVVGLGELVPITVKLINAIGCVPLTGEPEASAMVTDPPPPLFSPV